MATGGERGEVPRLVATGGVPPLVATGVGSPPLVANGGVTSIHVSIQVPVQTYHRNNMYQVRITLIFFLTKHQWPSFAKCCLLVVTLSPVPPGGVRPYIVFIASLQVSFFELSNDRCFKIYRNFRYDTQHYSGVQSINRLRRNGFRYG